MCWKVCGGTIEHRGARATEAKTAEIGALELLAQHRLFRSDHTGSIIRPEFTRFAFPPRWHYDTFRALDYFARAGAPCDPRLGEAIELLRQKRHADGCWRITYKNLQRAGVLRHGKGRRPEPLEHASGRCGFCAGGETE